MRNLSIQVPEGATAGDSLTFIVDGNELEIPVPEGASPGDVLQISVGDGEGSDGKEASTVEVPVYGGEKLVFDTSLDSASGPASDETDDGTHSFPWRSGLLLAEFLSGESSAISSIRVDQDSSVLELGSGLGLAGLAFGVRFKENIRHLVLTDLPPSLPLLKNNVGKVSVLIPPAAVKPLRWSVDPSMLPNERYNWIVVSDVLYNIEEIPALSHTVEYLLAKGGQILVAVRWRKPDLERVFFETLSKSTRMIRWTLLSGSSGTCWDKYGTSSDTFYAQAMVSVGGNAKPIGSIDEADQESMSASEYDAWEDFHIQVYHGKCT